MSFTDEVKHELIRYENQTFNERQAELAALLRITGSISIINKKLSVQLRLKYGDLARLIYSWLKNNYQLEVEIIVRKNTTLKKEQYYELNLPPQNKLEILLADLGIFNKKRGLDFSIKNEFLKSNNTGKAYLRGLFIGGGSINHPKSGYHLEFRCEHHAQAKDLIKLLSLFSISAKMVDHKDRYMVYLKDFESITKLLNVIGAQQSQLKMEDAKILREIKNDVNRKLNFETANLDKTIKAAMQQIEDIELVEQETGLLNLTSSLQEMARLRMKNPYASIKELGEMLDPPLTKSGVNHRLRRIHKKAEKIRGNN
ncbi:MAG: DNA-binding protein WhiA [Bacillota bacterium]